MMLRGSPRDILRWLSVQGEKQRPKKEEEKFKKNGDSKILQEQKIERQLIAK